MKKQLRWMMIGCAVCLSGRAATVTTNGTEVVIDVPEGETYAYAQTLASPIATVTKTGAGTAEFPTAIANFEGTFNINAGFIDFKVVNAYGKGPINVADGGGMIVSHASTGQQTVQVNGTVTIAGAGPDGMGALRCTGGGTGDQMYRKVVLAADASWGGTRQGTLELDMQFHTLTWVGGNQMSLGCAWKNFGAYVHKGTGDLCFQSGSFDASCTSAKTITLEPPSAAGNGTISYWNFDKPVPFSLLVNKDASISANWMGDATHNRWSGPVNVGAGTTLDLRCNNWDRYLRMTGPISGAGAIKVTNGQVYLSNEGNTWSGGTIVTYGNLHPLSPATLPGLDTPGGVKLSSGNSQAYLHLHTQALPNETVQHAWTADEIKDVFDNVWLSGMGASIAIDVPAGETFTYPYSIPTNFSTMADGTLVVTQPVLNPAYVLARRGKIVFDAPGSHAINSLCANAEIGVIDVKNGDLSLSNMIRVGNTGRGALWQEGGSVTMMSTDTPYFGESPSTYGAWLIDGGEATIRNSLNLGVNTNAYAAFVQKGGTFKLLNKGSINCGSRGDAMMYVAGGTNDTRYTASQGSMLFVLGCDTSGTATLTVTGSNTLLRTDGLIVGNKDAMRTNVLNVVDGGMIEASRFFTSHYDKGKPYTNSLSVVNADGGVFYPTFAWGWDHIGDQNVLSRAPNKFVLWNRGVVFDTSKCMDNVFTYYSQHTNLHHVDPPSGKGFDSITLPATALSQTYIGPARVRINDATGWGATAFADFDKATGRLTGVIVTSRGCDYSANPRVTVDSPDGKTVYVCTFELSENGPGGGLTKRGAQAMYLYNTNTYNGVTCVEQGSLIAGRKESIPDNSACRVKAGATLQVPNGMRPLRAIGGAGTITGSAITARGVVAYAEDLNAKKGVTVNNALTFAEGATVRVADPEAMNEGGLWPLATATSAIQGPLPAVDVTGLARGPWGTKLSDDGKTLYLTFSRGTTILLR